MEVLLESRRTFDVASVPTFGLVNLVFSGQTVFFFLRVRASIYG